MKTTPAGRRRAWAELTAMLDELVGMDTGARALDIQVVTTDAAERAAVHRARVRIWVSDGAPYEASGPTLDDAYVALLYILGGQSPDDMPTF